MKKQKNAREKSKLKLLLLAVGIAGLAQPALAGPVIRDVLSETALLGTVEAPPSLGGISLRRYQPWQPAVSYQASLVSNGYGPVSAQDGSSASTAAESQGIDPIQTAAIIPGVFGSVALSMRNFPVSARWAPVYQAIASCTAGSPCDHESQPFAAMVAAAQAKGFVEKLAFINSGINRLIAYRKDSVVYGKLDYWAKPSEILAHRAGDCEDFAILKMTALLRAGIPARSMSLVVLQDRKRGFFHAVLSVSTASGAYILDSLNNTVLKDSALPDYQPLYSFSTDRAWIHGSRTGGARVADVKGGFESVAPGEGVQMDVK
ncbi:MULTISPECIES: transglutaminase-like cysteine peptidase [unclassified Mesorhizobium]|uniref:transglutaminase-like cysteine peptidase n=1 Tax=unclassified Mesorhizobium TaxID=325217 RepID=UPI001CCAF757|nr:MULTISPECIES: transglutaminase-like cysteine peptidase [unclassified Mesorhizobium]MBZ9740938.1 transglutaminase-like cysteine peptidase [Mesorhizobium sp. CO1-1-4]MBZ9804455.1 transglutaminase-like cysteine peptidase [Mesorhizobium sp. ES1-6]